MHPPGSRLGKGTTGEVSQSAFEIPDAFLANAPGDRDMNRIAHLC